MNLTPPVIQTSGLKKSFGVTDVLKGVDLAIPEGAIVGLIGTNGAGKSTLLKCLLGLLRISEGTASVYGEDPWDLSPSTKARLGYVPQTVKFYPWMNVWQMVEYTAAHYDNWDFGISDRMLKDFDLKTSDPVRVLSTGQQQRLGLVLAMGHHPDLLILDEPAASLDPSGRRTLLRSLLDILRAIIRRPSSRLTLHQTWNELLRMWRSCEMVLLATLGNSKNSKTVSNAYESAVRRHCRKILPWQRLCGRRCMYLLRWSQSRVQAIQ